MRTFWVFSCFGLMAVMYLIYQSIKWGAEEHKWQEWFFKGAAAAMSALLAGYGYFSHPAPERLMILIGLCVFAAADVILDRSFLAGLAAFGLGRLCCCAAMLISRAPGRINLIVFLALLCLILALIPQMKKLAKGRSPLPYQGYALLLAAMTSLAVTQKPLLLAGAVLFAVSDGMLLFQIVKNIKAKRYDYLYLGSHFLALFLIAASTVF